MSLCFLFQSKVLSEEAIAVRMKLDYRPVRKAVRDTPDLFKVDDFVLWEWIQAGGEQIVAKRQVRMFRQDAYLITVRRFGGSPWGWVRKGRRSLAWFKWPLEGQQTITVEGDEGILYSVRLAHPIGFARNELWQAAPEWVGS